MTKNTDIKGNDWQQNPQDMGGPTFHPLAQQPAKENTAASTVNTKEKLATSAEPFESLAEVLGTDDPNEALKTDNAVGRLSK